MKVRVTVENLETGEKVSQIGDGAMAYVEDRDMSYVLSLGDYQNLLVVSHLNSLNLRQTSKLPH
mgnify:CR=1 FL=1